MIVRQSELEQVLAKLESASEIAVDTETTGLLLYHEDRLFSLIAATEAEEFYFNFQPYDGLDPDLLLPCEVLDRIKPIFASLSKTFYLHNAKFDMAALARFGIELGGTVWCTEAMARIEFNDHMSYSLDDCVQRIGYKKDDKVMEYIKEHHLWEWEQIPGKKTRSKRLFFNKVPLDIIVPYAEKDARITFDLARHQAQAFADLAAGTPSTLPGVLTVACNERAVTKVFFDMERHGVLIDKSYCERSIEHETRRYREAASEFERLTGIPFTDSGKVLAQAFSKVGAKFGTTDKGNPSFTDDVLATLDSPIARVVQEYRDAYKRANTYYRNFLYFADAQGRIHANARQAGTGTGRVSYTEPNLQNLNKEEGDAEFKVRRAFVPTPGNCWISIDYKAMEFRMLVDYAKLKRLADKILAGLDPHDETAKLVGIPRKQAKTLNFGLLYGMGVSLLAETLGVPVEEASRIKRQYFDALPEVEVLIRSVTRAASLRGHIFNWAGRRSYFPNPEFSYKAPNFLIQGGCADVVKFAMVKIHQLLQGKRSRLTIQVHDELNLDMHPSELHLLPEIVGIMENVYPHKVLPLQCSVSHSWTSWGDLVEGAPN
jgi:DNA polymerase I